MDLAAGKLAETLREQASTAHDLLWVGGRGFGVFGF
jgi:hypothetical protein